MAKKKSKKAKVNLDLNNDGVFDKKDKSIAAKILRKNTEKGNAEVQEGAQNDTPVEEANNYIAKIDINRTYRKGDTVPKEQVAQWKINGFDISSTSLVKWNIKETFGDETSECVIRTTNQALSQISGLRAGMTITIKRGLTTSTDQFVFEGLSYRIDKQGPNVFIYGQDLLVQLVKAKVTKSFDGVAFPSTEAKGSDIAKTLIEDFGGLTALVVDTGTTLTLKKFVCVGTDVLSRLQALADIFDYQIFYDPDDSKVHFEPKGQTAATDTLIVGGASSNVNNLPKWSFDNSQCVNKLTVKGAVQEVQDTEKFDGDGSTIVFTLANKPISVNLTVDGVEKTPGVEDSTATFDYTIDKENKTITFESGSIPPAGSDNIVVTYVRALPVPVQVQDSTSIGKYGTYDGEKYFSDIQTVADAEQRGNGWLKIYSEPFTRVTLKPAILIDFDVGNATSVVDNINSETRTVVITQVKKSFPHKGDELYCGDREWKIGQWGSFTLERIRRLEEENQKNVELLIQVQEFPHTVTFIRRYLDAFIKTIDTDGYILDHISQGVLGTNKLGAAFTAAEVLVRRVWPNQTYIEKFIDTTFEGASTGGTNWDTTNKRLAL